MVTNVTHNRCQHALREESERGRGRRREGGREGGREGRERLERPKIVIGSIGGLQGILIVDCSCYGLERSGKLPRN